MCTLVIQHTHDKAGGSVVGGQGRRAHDDVMHRVANRPVQARSVIHTKPEGAMPVRKRATTVRRERLHTSDYTFYMHPHYTTNND